jgi:hypothetical protein
MRIIAHVLHPQRSSTFIMPRHISITPAVDTEIPEEADDSKENDSSSDTNASFECGGLCYGDCGRVEALLVGLTCLAPRLPAGTGSSGSAC